MKTTSSTLGGNFLNLIIFTNICDERLLVNFHQKIMEDYQY